MKHTGIITEGEEVLTRLPVRCGTATPTKDIGPAKAVTEAASRLDVTISIILSAPTFTPILSAYAGPSLYALMGLIMHTAAAKQKRATALIIFTCVILIPFNDPIDQL